MLRRKFMQHSGLLLRFFYAFIGAVTFFAAFYAYHLLPLARSLLLDPILKAIAPVIVAIGLILASLWFAWIVAFADNQHGPIRLYLSGFVLPLLVWTIIDIALIPDITTAPTTTAQ